MDLSRLKRFDKAKHEQLEGLLQWCQLMGLTGKDLVSLGGHIDRWEANEAMAKNKEIVKGIKIDKVGSDHGTENRWTIKTPTGRYLFEIGGYYDDVTVTSYKTKVRKTFHVHEHKYQLGRGHWRQRQRMAVLLDYHYGDIKLDF